MVVIVVCRVVRARSGRDVGWYETRGVGVKGALLVCAWGAMVLGSDVLLERGCIVCLGSIENGTS